jgi:hypothetical protein
VKRDPACIRMAKRDFWNRQRKQAPRDAWKEAAN